VLKNQRSAYLRVPHNFRFAWTHALQWRISILWFDAHRNSMNKADKNDGSINGNVDSIEFTAISSALVKLDEAGKAIFLVKERISDGNY